MLKENGNFRSKLLTIELEGKIIAVLPMQSGISKSTGKNWQSQEFVIETVEQYPKKCCFRVFGEDKINSLAIHISEELTVSLDIDSHEYNGRWYNNFTAWAVKRKEPSSPIENQNMSQVDLPFWSNSSVDEDEPPF